VDYFAYLLRLLSALVVVFGLLFGLRWYMLRRAAFFASAPANQLHVRERVWLSARTQVVILEVGGEAFLVCTTDHAVQVTPLSELPPLVQSDTSNPLTFAAHLEQIFSFLRQGGKK
jgi:flagellar biogenesis protein FliO